MLWYLLVADRNFVFALFIEYLYLNSYKGFIRSVNAAANKIERENKRKQKEYEKLLKA